MGSVSGDEIVCRNLLLHPADILIAAIVASFESVLVNALNTIPFLRFRRVVCEESYH